MFEKIKTPVIASLSALILAAGCHSQNDKRIDALVDNNRSFSVSDSTGVVQGYGFYPSREKPELIILEMDRAPMLIYDGHDPLLHREIIRIEVGDTVTVNEKGYITKIDPRTRKAQGTIYG